MGRWFVPFAAGRRRPARRPPRPARGEARGRGGRARQEGAARRRAYNPPTMALSNRDNAWKNWGLTEKPADFDRRFRERYGLHPAPYPNDGLPMGMRFAPTKFSWARG